jgi:membrane protein DedA with SNARE-associated domain
VNASLANFLPLGFENWMPASQVTTIALLTFVQEDIPTVGAALLAAGGQLGWKAAYLACFFGIWIGDALLYLVARTIGRPMLEKSFPRILSPAKITQSEKWFARKGIGVLAASRCIPGARLPTYLVAGFLKSPFGPFLLVTGIAVAIWTGAVFLLARTVGATLLELLSRWNSASWTLLLLFAGLLLLCRVIPRFADGNFRRRVRVTIVRWKHWEFWPPWLFYFPVALNYIRLATRYRGWTVPTAANPGIFSGGFVGESKMATLLDLQVTSPNFTAAAWLVEGSTPQDRCASFHALRAAHEIVYPLILKPDIGQRGVGVKIIRTALEAESYLNSASAPVIVQRYVPGPHEVGVFYYRFPHEREGHIFAITKKVFPRLVGDGLRTIEELVWQDWRARFLADKYLARLANRSQEILALGKTVKLVEAGNHAQGCIFQDGEHLWSRNLEQRIDGIAQRLNGFFIGRFDIRYSSETDLRAATNFQIIELNGASSEATSIYDARNSLVAAYRTLFRQWELVFAIGFANRERGCPATPLRTIWRKWRETNSLIASYPLAD